LNLSGGPPKAHEDKRGFPAVVELYAFVAENRDYFDGDRSGANVAILYSQDTLFYYGRDEARKRYVDAIRGVEQALSDHHVPFDIVSERAFASERMAQYDVLVLPAAACMSEATADAIRAFADRGGGVVATFETSLYDPDGHRRGDFLLADVFGATYRGTGSVMGDDDGVYKQAYMNVKDADHPLLRGLGNTRVVPAAQSFCRVDARPGAAAPLALSAAFRVFPEGMSYTREPETGFPMALTTERASGGRTVYFAGRPDASYLAIGYPDWGLLLANAAKWAARGRLVVETDAPPTLLTTVRAQPGRTLVHLVNVDGGRRMFARTTPARDVAVSVPAVDGAAPRRAFALSDKRELPIETRPSGATVVLDRVNDYEIVVFET